MNEELWIVNNRVSPQGHGVTIWQSDNLTIFHIVYIIIYILFNCKVLFYCQMFFCQKSLETLINTTLSVLTQSDKQCFCQIIIQSLLFPTPLWPIIFYYSSASLNPYSYGLYKNQRTSNARPYGLLYIGRWANTVRPYNS